MASKKKTSTPDLTRKASAQNVEAEDVLQQLSAMARNDKTLYSQMDAAINRALAQKRQNALLESENENAALRKRLAELEEDRADTKDGDKADPEADPEVPLKLVD